MVFGRKKRKLNRVLVVEDEPLIAFDTEYTLESEGFEVVATVDTVAEALAALQAHEIDLALLDINLSDGNGVEVARAAAAAGVCVIFATGACPGDADGVAHGCLAKPYGGREIAGAVAVLERLIAGRKAGRLPQGFTLFERAHAMGAAG